MLLPAEAKRSTPASISSTFMCYNLRQSNTGYAPLVSCCFVRACRLAARRGDIAGGAALEYLCYCAATTHLLSALTHGECH